MRLIDADKIEYVDWDIPQGNGMYITVGVVYRADIDAMPTVDAEPVRHVRHGEWIPDRTMNAYWVCSCCGFPSEAHGAFKIYKYCPNCGAKMDAERKSE